MALSYNERYSVVYTISTYYKLQQSTELPGGGYTYKLTLKCS